MFEQFSLDKEKNVADVDNLTTSSGGNEETFGVSFKGGTLEANSSPAVVQVNQDSNISQTVDHGSIHLISLNHHLLEPFMILFICIRKSLTTKTYAKCFTRALTFNGLCYHGEAESIESLIK